MEAQDGDHGECTDAVDSRPVCPLLACHGADGTSVTLVMESARWSLVVAIPTPEVCDFGRIDGRSAPVVARCDQGGRRMVGT